VVWMWSSPRALRGDAASLCGKARKGDCEYLIYASKSTGDVSDGLKSR